MKKALKKFKSDAPSKVIYDLIKYVFISILAVAGLTIFPALREWILSVFTIPIISFIIVIASSLLAGATLCYFIFRKKTCHFCVEQQQFNLTVCCGITELTEKIIRRPYWNVCKRH